MITHEAIVKAVLREDRLGECGFNCVEGELCDSCCNRRVTEYEESIRAEGIRKFADKIKAHMIKYCHGRLDQQFCAIEIIDYIGKLMGKKDYSIDVESEMEKHDEEIRADERAKTIKEIEDRLHEVYQMNAYCSEDYCTEDGLSCDDCLKVKIYQVLQRMKEGEQNEQT